jgi:Clostripain family
LIYVMSYDNDLSICGPGILDALERGVKGGETLATVLADDPDPGGLTRHVISSDGRTSQRLATDDSASEAVLSDYLTWVAEAHPSKHYAVVFLDHGGRLDEMCLDERPGGGGTKHWLNARLVGERLRAFRAGVPGSVELVFLQQCGRGSVQNLYNFRNTAAAVLASQHNVGAPNTYYEPTLQWLDAHPDTSGVELASRIMADDRDFITYACADGKALGELPRRLRPVAQALLEGDTPPVPPADLTSCFVTKGEANFDLLAWFGAAFRENGRSAAALDDFSRWVREGLVVKVVTEPCSADQYRSVCGLSLFVPRSEDQLTLYRDEPLHHDCLLGSLWEALEPRGRD